jgi:hypothetical protein
MNKIPVGKTVAFAYTFLFRNLGVIIGLIWIPMLLVTVFGFFAQSTYIDATLSYLATKNQADLAPGILWMFVFVFVALLANALMLVPVVQQALGIRTGHAMVHFSPGPPEWRMFGAYLALLGMVFVVMIAVAFLLELLLAGFGAAGLDSTSPPVQLVFNVLPALIGIAVAVALVRVAFFIPAMAVLEDKVELRRGWVLTRGNTLRLIAIIILAVLPIVVVYSCVDIVLFGVSSIVPRMDSGEISAAETVQQLQVLRSQLPLSDVLAFLFAPLGVGLNAGIVAAAYRALAPQKPA